MKDSKINQIFQIQHCHISRNLKMRISKFTSTSIITVDFFFDSIEQVQLTLFGYSFGNIGLIKLTPFDNVILRFEQTSIMVESKS